MVSLATARSAFARARSAFARAIRSARSARSIICSRPTVQPPECGGCCLEAEIPHGHLRGLPVGHSRTSAIGIAWERTSWRATQRDGVGGAGFRTGAVIQCRRWGWQHGATVDLPYMLQDDL